MRLPDLSRVAEALWYGRSPLVLLLVLPLVPLSWLFALGVFLRRRAYALGLFGATRLAVPVIVVGNITVGGAGKTPVVDQVVRTLRAAGFRPGIISRGYGGRPAAEPRLVTVDASAAEVGDEPLLLKRRTGAPVCVFPDRIAAGRMLLATGEVDVIVADDGLQHYRLARDIEIVVIDGARRFGNGHLLPAGPLREPVSRVAEADLRLINGGRAEAGEAGFALVAESAILPDGSRSRPLASFAGQAVRMVAGIADPARFRRSLEALGIIVETVPVADHGRCDIETLLGVTDTPILMTEKDAVKYALPSTGLVWIVPVDLRMAGDGMKDFLLGRLRELRAGDGLRR